jgi:hypothetical protein
MARQPSKNKISDKEARRATRIHDRLKKQHVGQDNAAHIAERQAVKELHSGQGGGRNSGGEPQKGAETRAGPRPPSAAAIGRQKLA